jgi:hypothetical protein
MIAETIVEAVEDETMVAETILEAVEDETMIAKTIIEAVEAMGNVHWDTQDKGRPCRTDSNSTYRQCLVSIRPSTTYFTALTLLTRVHTRNLSTGR